MNLREKCALVVGASSGMGEAIARRLVHCGYRVAMVARRGDVLDSLAAELNSAAGAEVAFPFPADVTDYQHVPALFEKVFEALGGLTVMIYAAGSMPKVAVDEYNFSKDQQMVETNLLGMMAWANCAADLFHRLKQGTIVGIGSIAGDRGRKAQPGYNTSKGAQAIFLESLRNRLDREGVRVVTIKPGFVQTPMTAGLGNLLWMISADEAARRIVSAAERSHGVVYVPRRWRLVSWIIGRIPSVIFRKLDI